MSYGLTLGYGSTTGAPALDGTTVTRQVNVADIRFNGQGEVRNARVPSFDLANLDRDRRFNDLTGESRPCGSSSASSRPVSASACSPIASPETQDMPNG